MHRDHVLLEADFRTEFLTAHVTHKSTVFAVKLIHMHGQIFMTDKFRITQFTFNVFILSVVFIVFQSVVVQTSLIVTRAGAYLTNERRLTIVSRVYVQAKTGPAVKTLATEVAEYAVQFHMPFLMSY